MKNELGKFDVGQGISINDVPNNPLSSTAFALIVDKNEDGVKIVPVKRLRNLTEMYNRSNNNNHKHNVPLQDCPPPFTYGDKSEVYAVADVKHARFVAFDAFKKYNVRTSDNYARISDRDLALVFDHSLIQKGDREFTRRQTTNTMVNRELPFVNEGYSDSDIDFGSLGR
jgi:hypothetical protein